MKARPPSLRRALEAHVLGAARTSRNSITPELLREVEPVARSWAQLFRDVSRDEDALPAPSADLPLLP